MFSADSHVVEPASLFAVGSGYHGSAPKLKYDSVLGHAVDFGDGRKLSVGRFGIAGLRLHSDEARAQIAAGYEGLPARITSPEQRMRAMREDGVTGELLFPSLFFGAFAISDLRLQKSIMCRYNEWVRDFASRDTAFFVPAALTGLHPLATPEATLRVALTQGFRAICIPCSLPVGLSYGDEALERFWAIANESAAVVCMHVFTGSTRNMGLPEHWDNLTTYSLSTSAICASVIDLISSGVTTRFPRVRFLLAEWELGGIPTFLRRLDHAWYRNGMQQKVSLDGTPSEHFWKHFFMTFQDDGRGVAAALPEAKQRLLWANDYPHHDSVWPQSHSAVQRSLEWLPEGERDHARAFLTQVNARATLGIPIANLEDGGSSLP